jgi:hypothetical protein
VAGLHTVGVRDSLNAINGIGHAAVVTDPQFRAALVDHGFTLADGEITQLAGYVGAFSQRAAQIGRNLDRYEAEWTAANPCEQPGPRLRRAWDARAWAEARPDKVIPRPGTDLHGRWLTELAELGYRDRDKPVDLAPHLVGSVDRDRAAKDVVQWLQADRSAWNAADVRGEVEQLIAREGMVADGSVRAELAEDLTARALDGCIPLLDRAGLPENIRALTSRYVLDVEADLARRLAIRAAGPCQQLEDTTVPEIASDDSPTGRQLDAGTSPSRCRADRRPDVGCGGRCGRRRKTTTLAATSDKLIEQRRRLLVVTPTLKAAKVAQAEVGGHTGSAAWLVPARMAVGRARHVDSTVLGRRRHANRSHLQWPGPTAQLQAGDLLVVDEAGCSIRISAAPCSP